MNVYLQDELRIKGITRGAEIDQRVKQDAALRAAVALEQEQRAEVLRHQEALARQAQARTVAENEAVARLAALRDLYAQREEAARQAIESLAAVWRIESEIRNGLQLADRSLFPVEATVDPTMRGQWRLALRDRAGLPARHMFNAPKSWITTEAQRVGATCIMGVTSSVIKPGLIEVGRDVVNFEI